MREEGKSSSFGGGKNGINFVSVQDVARFVSIALDDPRARNAVIEVGGPENLTMNQLAEIFERASGRQAKKRHIPLPLMRAISILMQPINPTMSRLIRNGIYMDTAKLHYETTATARAFGVKPTPFEEIARRATSNHAQLEPASKLK